MHIITCNTTPSRWISISLHTMWVHIMMPNRFPAAWNEKRGMRLKHRSHVTLTHLQVCVGSTKSEYNNLICRQENINWTSTCRWMDSFKLDFSSHLSQSWTLSNSELAIPSSCDGLRDDCSILSITDAASNFTTTYRFCKYLPCFRLANPV